MLRAVMRYVTHKHKIIFQVRDLIFHILSRPATFFSIISPKLREKEGKRSEALALPASQTHTLMRLIRRVTDQKINSFPTPSRILVRFEFSLVHLVVSDQTFRKPVLFLTHCLPTKQRKKVSIALTNRNMAAYSFMPYSVRA